MAPVMAPTTLSAVVIIALLHLSPNLSLFTSVNGALIAPDHVKRQEPVLSQPTTLANGRCGKGNGGAVCDKSPFGHCCSQYGWCGSTTDHCGFGCQSGACSSSVSGGAVVTKDGTCGSSNGNTVCGAWPEGSCCSQYGWCGSTPGHCGTGCQSGPCTTGGTGGGGGGTGATGTKLAPATSLYNAFITVGDSLVPAMHSAVLATGNVVFLDKVENYTKVKLGNGQYAYSSEYSPSTNEAVPLAYKTNAFCSGGAFLKDGTLVSLGGNLPLSFIDPTVGDGLHAVRFLHRTPTGTQDGQDWVEDSHKLDTARWYPTGQIQPNGDIFVVSGSLNGYDPSKDVNNNPTWEILDASGTSIIKSTSMKILVDNQPYYMYPIVSLLPNGCNHIFVSKSSQVFCPYSNTIQATHPDLAGLYRTYPNAGGAQMLPLKASNNWEPSFLVCGGGSYQDITSPTDASCGRINPLDTDAKWEMDALPMTRTMGEMQLLPNGKLLVLNGASTGSEGFLLSKNPVTQALLYDPDAPLGKRWSTCASSGIARLYHSVTNLLPDGDVLIAGSNPNEQPVLTPDAGHPFPTEFRVERFHPPYVAAGTANTIANWAISSTSLKADGSTFTVKFTASRPPASVMVTLFYQGFNTHAVHMGERCLILDFTGFDATTASQQLMVKMPPNANVAPPGGAWVYVLADGYPAARAMYVMVS